MKAEDLGEVWDRLRLAPAAEAGAALLSSALMCALFGVVIGFAVAVARRRFGAGKPVGWVGDEERALAGAALAVGAVWFVDLMVRGYVLNLSATTAWWQFAIAPVTAGVSLFLFALALRTPRTRARVTPGAVARRTWRSYGPTGPVMGAFGALIVGAGAVTVACGAASTQSAAGSPERIALGIPNTDLDPLVVLFPGWAYGLPLLVALGALTLATILALHRNAVRPFRDGDSLDDERARRRRLSTGVVAVASAGVLLGLAGLLRMARSAAAGSMTVRGDGLQSMTYAISSPYGELLVLGGVVASVMHIAACAALTVMVVDAAWAQWRPVRRPAPAGALG
ncbi:hypothetical protein [Microbacterium testaceum]|uniref:hypothetical protein n=1 Tax=Microbacterium testaceum TaxID=2033 RepID=UPI002AC3EC55|nr:hypothetical protein [Microbacterium testaceum]MDZ5144489.1 hypothetical protein [Microbacterium testaceum]